jgi:hypothetical protein
VSPGRHARQRSLPPIALGATALIVAGTGTGVAATRGADSPARRPAVVRVSDGPVLLDDRFGGRDGLITNEYASEHPGTGTPSPTWLVTSGSLFRRGGVGWSGAPDTAAPGPTSASGTNSDVFRMVTRRDDFGNVRVRVEFQVVRFDNRGPRDAFDGLHVFLRYTSPQSLLVVSVCRRDNVAAVKKKVEGGSTNGGTYYTLAQAGSGCAVGQWHTADVDVRDVGDGVQVDVSVDGRHVLTATDAGTGGPPMQGKGRVGIRADYVEFLLRRFTVSQL